MNFNWDQLVHDQEDINVGFNQDEGTGPVIGDAGIAEMPTIGSDCGSVNPSTTVASSENVGSALGGRKRSSIVWEHFELVDVDGDRKARCKNCRKDLSCKLGGGTGHLQRHIKSHQNQLVTAQATLNFTSGSLGMFSYSQEVNRRELAKFIVKSEQPFAFAEDPNFEYYVHNALQPKYKKISRITMRSDALKIFNQYRINLLNIFQKLSTISLTSDVWTNQHNGVAYICVTAHWIDDDFLIQKRIISFKSFEHPHTSNAIYRAITAVTYAYGLNDKIFSISFDNASNNDAAIPSLKNTFSPILNGKLFHIRCACHILNLCVQDGLKVINHHVENVRNAIKFIRSSGPRQQEFKRLCISMGKKFKKFKIDVITRWNSTYDMLNICMPYKDIISLFYNEKMPGEPILEADWEFAMYICNILEIFYNATRQLSGIYYPTSCLLLQHLSAISEIFSMYRNNYIFAPIIHSMEIKLKKYWENISPLFCLAAIMDPRIKLNGLEIILDQYYENMQLEGVAEKKAEISVLLHEMFTSYDTKYGQRSTTSSVSASSTTCTGGGTSKLMLHILRGKKSSQRSSSYNELSLYLEHEHLASYEETQLLDDFDILTWWKSQAKSFPVVSAMARDLLTPPVSSVASESCFSAGNRVLDDKRSRMNEESMEMCICLKDWLDAEDRLQDKGGHDTSSSGEGEDQATGTSTREAQAG